MNISNGNICLSRSRCTFDLMSGDQPQIYLLPFLVVVIPLQYTEGKLSTEALSILFPSIAGEHGDLWEPQPQGPHMNCVGRGLANPGFPTLIRSYRSRLLSR